MHLATVQARQLAHERETDAEAAAGALQRVVALHEHVEYAIDQFRGDAGPLVVHGEDGLAVVVLQPDIHLPARRTELHGI